MTSCFSIVSSDLINGHLSARLHHRPLSSYYMDHNMQKTAMDASCDSTLSTFDSTADYWDRSNQMQSPDEAELSIDKKFNWQRKGNSNNESNSDNFHNQQKQNKHDLSQFIGPHYADPHCFSPTAEEESIYKPRRVSSLKTNRTPPGTPKSKAVRFADAFGLDLEDVRHIFNLDQPPKIPASAVQDLVLENFGDSCCPFSTGSQESLTVAYRPHFSQPGAAPDFLRQLRMAKVSLENAFVANNIVSGTVRVMNISFDKRIIVRVSFTEWQSHMDVEAAYVRDSHDGVTDRFSFSLLLPPHSQLAGSRTQLAICFECNGGNTVFWDNNRGQNYIFTCDTASATGDTPSH